MDQDPVAKLDAFLLKEDELFSLFDRERAIKLARVVSTAALVMSLLGIVVMAFLKLSQRARSTNFFWLVFEVVVAASVLLGIGWWSAFHDDQFGAAIAVVGGMLTFTLGFQVAWEVNNGLDSVAVALFLLTALPIGLSGVLGEPKLMLATTVLVIVLTCVVCFIVPGNQRMSLNYRLIIAVVTIFVQAAIAGCISLAALFYIHTLQRASIIGEAYRQIRRLDTMKEDFIHNVNHELRTPFMTLSASTEMLYLTNDTLTPPERTRYLRLAYDATERMSTILTTVLNFQRTGVGVGTVVFAPVVVHDAVREALALAEMFAPMGSHPLRVDVAERLRIWGNVALLQEALTNLLTNAHKYSAPQSPIEIVAYQRKALGAARPHIELRVRDFGLGIPPKDAHLLFQRLSRLPRDIESNVPGSGLGLSHSKLNIEAMQGTIRFESTGRPGEGTVFIITLPTPPPEAPASPPPNTK